MKGYGTTTLTMLRNRSWPAVSQSWSRTLTPSMMSFFVRKLAPIVLGIDEALNWPDV